MHKLYYFTLKRLTFEMFQGFVAFKGIVQPNINILSLFTHPRVVKKLYDFFLLLQNMTENILRKVGDH